VDVFVGLGDFVEAGGDEDDALLLEVALDVFPVEFGVGGGAAHGAAGCLETNFNLIILIDAITTQHYCCVVIPRSVSVNSFWNVLPPGVHQATLEEIERRFATNEKRRLLFVGFQKAVYALLHAGCATIFLDGSFITDKPEPGDFDACWDPKGVDVTKLDPVLLDFDNHRKTQKEKFGGELFPSASKADGVSTFVSFFQVDKFSGQPKGIIKILLPVGKELSS